MEVSASLFWDLFLNTLSFWWIILPAMLLGLIVGAIPGFSAANTIIILLPLTFAMEVEQGIVFMVALYSSSRMGAGIPAILVNIPGTAGAAFGIGLAQPPVARARRACGCHAGSSAGTAASMASTPARAPRPEVRYGRQPV